MTSKPRITFSRKPDGSLEIWLNPAGRDLFVAELQALNEQNEHFHIAPEGVESDLPARDRRYGSGDEIMDWGKVLFRLDEWDREYYPHVMDDD